MSGGSARVDEALRDLRTAVMPMDGVESVAGRRERTVSHLELVQARIVKRNEAVRKRSRLVGFAVLAAAFVGGAMLFSRSRATNTAGAERESFVSVLSGTAVVDHATHRTVIATGTREPVEDSDTLDVPTDGSALLALTSGATVHVRASTRLVLRDTGAALHQGRRSEIVDLPLGTVEVQVPKLGAGTSLAVQTPNATVTVHGTRFLVDVTREGAKDVTHVHVDEGVVGVDHGADHLELRAGSDWSSEDTSDAEESASAAAAASTALTPSASVRRDAKSDPDTKVARSGTSRVGHPEESARLHSVTFADAPSQSSSAVSEKRQMARGSTLERENALLEEGMAAARRSNDRSALRTFDRLIAEYPGSPLLEAAKLERRRAMERLNLAQSPEQTR